MLPHAEAPEPSAAARRTSRPAGDAGATSWRPWREAWREAAYGPDGFWSHERSHDHFATGVGAGPSVARAVAGAAPEVGVVVDVGAGDGALLQHLAGLLPGAALLGVDRRPRPDGLDARVRWCTDHWDDDVQAWERGGPDAWLAGPALGSPPLLVAHEWLDDLPATVAEHGREGWREVEVDHAGRERPGGTVAADDAAWLARWWPVAPRSEGVRAEVGRSRDDAWAALVRAALAREGRAVAVDYGHRADARPAGGSLVAYAGGRQHRPAPDGSTNLTAGVAVDALAAAGEAAGARTLALRQQAEVLADLAAESGADPLAALVRRSEHAALTAPGRWGGLWWLLQGGPEPAVS